MNNTIVYVVMVLPLTDDCYRGNLVALYDTEEKALNHFPKEEEREWWVEIWEVK